MRIFVLSVILFGSRIFEISAQISNGLHCSRYCKENRNDFGYENGWVYSYKYTANVTTFINSSSDTEAQRKNVISLSTSVHIYTLSSCDYKMEISPNVEESQRDLSAKLTKYPLHFSFNNGKIDTVCSNVNEEVEILNIKRAILSSFQNSNQPSILYETDINGVCETEYQIVRSPEDSNYLVQKIKNLEACSHRSEKYFSWQSEPYNKKQANSSPLLRSTQKCLQTYNDRMILQTSICEEKHLFQPFSNGEQGAVTLLTQKLELHFKKYNEHPKISIPLEFERSNLLYKKVDKTARKSDDFSEILELLDVLETNTKNGITSDVPTVFFTIVNLLENVQKEALVKIFDSVKNSDKKKKFFLDAMPLITTVDGIEIMKKLKAENELTQAEFDSWMGSLLFIKNPTVDVLEALSTLITTSSPTKQKSVLTISGLIHRFCKSNKCEGNEKVTSIIHLLEEPFKKTCTPVDFTSQENILLALKAIGNAGVTTSYHHLRNCFMKTDATPEIRLAAIAAHRRINCGQNENFESMQNVFGDVKENTEIRIASYLALMQCSSYAVFNKVKDVLYKEEINQVASFVWTHLINLQDTSCQWKQKLKRLIENEFLKNKFNTDLRKYSRNYELSNFFDSINTGASLEGNAIFTSESYLPKSGMLNLTLDLFGESVNIFEIGARINGFEDVVEELFGPENSLLEIAKSEHELMNKINELGEAVRSKTILKQNPNGLLYAKIFGNEISYTHFKDLNDIFGQSITLQNAFDILKKVFSKNDIEYTKTFKFLDSTYTIPTLLGFPLEVSVNGTATLGLTVKGKIDVQDFWKHKLRIEGKVYPNAIVEVVGAMTVNAFSTKTGLKSVSTANSNSYLDGHIVIDGGKLVDLKLNVPKKQMDIINVRSELLLFQNEKSVVVDDVTSNVENWEGCTPAVFGKIIGLQLCSNYKYVNASQEKYAPYFPLTGSFKYSVNVKKVDVFDSYQLRWSSNFEPNTALYFVSLYMDTPNSQVNRKFNVSAYLDKKAQTLEAKLDHPFATMELLCRLERGLHLKAIFNNKEVISFESFLHVLPEEYKVEAKLNYKEKALATISGSMSNKDNKYAMYLVVNDAKVNLVIVPNFGSYAITSEVYSNGLRATLNATINVTSDFVSVASRCSHNYKNKRDDISFNFNLGKIKKIETHRGTLYLDYKSTLNPFYNTLISFNNERSDMYFENYGKLLFFGITWDTHQLLKFRQPKENLDAALLCTLTCIQKDIDYQIILAHNSSKVDFNVHGLLQLNRVQRMEALIKHETVNEDQQIRLLLYYPKKALSLRGELKKIRVDEIDIKLTGQKQIDDVVQEFLKVEGKYINSTRDRLRNYTFNAVVDFVHFWKSPWLINSTMQHSKDLFISSVTFQLHDDKYSTRLMRTQETFITEVQMNNKKLLVVNGKKNEDGINLTLGLNIYQNFEFSIRMKPYTQLDLKLYWDKDRDFNQKVFLTINGNNNGFFVMNLEYPYQKVVASFTLLPTQVTLNVTWGLAISQKMYLKVGNKIYDVGGVWFGELETPFKYFERQKFRLKYLILKQNIETETNISWLDHKINLTAAVSRTASSIRGFLEITSTLSQITKLGVALSHTCNSTDLIKRRETGASFVYNEHQVTGESIWRSHGLDVSSTFQIVSSTNTIRPIFGELIINNNETTNYFNSVFSWQGSNVSAGYKFENSRSHIIIKTPFTGVEETKLVYGLVKSSTELTVEIEVNVLQQLNYVLLKWKDNDVQFEIISPMTGIYQLYLKHSPVFGYLREDLIVKQGKQNETILALQISGNINSISNIDAKLSVKALGHSMSVDVFNTPLSSIIEAKWDNNSLMSNLQFIAVREEITQVAWNLNSTLFNDFIKLQYYHIDGKYYTLLRTPNGYELENSLDLEYPYFYAENMFQFITPKTRGGLIYRHMYEGSIFNNNIRAYLNDDKFDYSTYARFIEQTYFPTNFSLNIITTWQDPIQLNFVLSEEYVNNKINLSLLFKWNNETTFGINSFIKYDLANNTLITYVDGSHIGDIIIEGSYNIDRNSIELRAKIKNVTGYAKVQWEDGYSVNVDVKSQNEQLVLDLMLDSQKFEIKAAIPTQFQLQADVRIGAENVSGAFNFMCPYSNNYASSFNIGRRQGFVNFEQNKKYLTLTYAIKSVALHNLDIVSKFQSTFNIMNNASLIIQYNRDYMNILVEGISPSYFLRLHSSMLLEFTTRKMIAKGKLESRLRIGNVDDLLNLFVNTDIQMVTSDNSSLITILLLTDDSNLNFAGHADSVGLYKADLFAKNKDELYILKYENLNFDYVKVVGTIEAPLYKLSAEMDSQRRKIYDYSNIETHFKLSKNDNEYNARVVTKHYDLLRSESTILLKSPGYEYEGLAIVNLGGTHNVINISLGDLLHKNNADFLLDVDGFGKLNSSLLLQLDVVELHPLKLTINSDLESERKKLLVEYFPDLHAATNLKLDVMVNKTNVQIYFDLPNKKDYLTLSGTHNIKGHEVSINFMANYNSTKLRGQIFHTTQNFVRTKIDITTTIKGWETTVFESKIDNDKVRTFFALKNHRLSVVANKEALFKGKEVLSIQYNGEQLLIIWSGRDQSYLITSTRYVKYRLGIQYVTDPQIYAFSILKDGENLLSFIIQNTSNLNYVHFKGKLIAPTLFPKYSNLSLQLHTDYHISKTFEFTLHNKNEELLEVKWSTQKFNKEYASYFKFRSQISMLQLFKIKSAINLRDVFVKSKIIFTQYGVQKEFFNHVVIPIKTSEMLLVSNYPCKDYGQCDFNFQVNKSGVDFHWTSPTENWKNVSFKACLQREHNSLTGFMFFEKNRRNFDSKWNFHLNSEHFNWYYNAESNLTDDLTSFGFKGIYRFYEVVNLEFLWNFWGLECNLVNDRVKRAQITFLYYNTKACVNSSLGLDKFDLTISNGDYVITNFTAVKRPRSYAFSFAFPNNCWEGKLLYDFDERYKILSVLKNNANYNLSLNFDVGRDRGGFKITDDSIPWEMFLNYELTTNIKADFVFKIGEEVISSVDITYLYSDTFVDSTVLVRSYNFDDKELKLKYSMKERSVLSVLKLSWSPRDEIMFKTNMQCDADNYIFDNELRWPESRTMTVVGKVVFTTKQNMIDLQMNSPYADPFRTTWIYNATNLLSTTSLGNKNITVNAKIILKTYVSIHLTSPFVGYTTGSLEAFFNENNRSAYLRIEKENLLTEFEGNITKSENNIHEIYMKAKPLMGPFALVQIKLDHNTMKLNGDVNWHNENVMLDLSYNPKNLHLNVDSTMDYAKKIRFSAVYINKQNSYYLVSGGYWNSINVIFNGHIHLDPGRLKINSELKIEKLYEGKFNLQCYKSDTEKLFEFSGYFPRPSSTVYLKFATIEQESSLTSHVILKTPFELFENLLLESISEKRKVNVTIMANIMKKDLTAFTSSFYSEQKILSKLGVSVPQDDQSFNLDLDVDFYKHGFLKFTNSHDYVIGYNISNNFEIIASQSKDNVVESKIYFLCQNDETRFDYYNNGDAVTIEKSSNGIWMIIDFPRILKSPIFTFYTDSTKRNLNVTLFGALVQASWNDSKTQINVLNILPFETLLTYKPSKDGFKTIIDTSIDGVDFSQINIVYLNNVGMFLFNIEQNNLDRNISTVYNLQFMKNLEKFEARLDDDFLLNLQITNDNTKLQFLNNYYDFIKCEIDTSRSLFSFMLQTYSLVDINVLAVIDVGDNKKLQFEYGSYKTNILKGKIELHNSQRSDSLRIDLYKLQRRIFNLEYDIKENSYSAKFNSDIFDSVHRSYFKLITSEPYSVIFEIISPILPNEGFAVLGTASTTSIYLSVGKRFPEFTIESEDQYLLLTSQFERKSIFVYVKLPNCDVVRSMYYKTYWDYKIFQTFNEIQIISSVLGNVSVVGEFNLEDEGLDLIAFLKLPFLENFSKFETEFHIHKNFNPWFYIHLPNNKNYSAHINYVNSDKILIHGGYIWADVKTLIKIEVNKMEPYLFAETYLPFDNYKHYGLTIQKNETKFSASVNLNDRLNRLDLEFPGGNFFKIELTTPFQNYDKYLLLIKERHDLETQFLTCLLFYPGLDHEIGFDIAHDLNYKVNYTISLPVSVYSFKYGSFSASFLKEPKNYSINAAIGVNSYSAKMCLMFGKSKTGSNLDFDFKTSGNNSILLLFNENNEYLNASITVDTKSILQLNYSYDNNILYFLCNTIWKSANVDYRSDDKNRFEITAKIWDVFDPENQYGGHFISTDRVSVGLYLPNRIVTADEQYFTNETHEYYFLRFAWNKSDAFGMKIRFFNISENHSVHVNSVIDLELPFRKFGLYYDIKVIQSFSIASHFVLKWGDDDESEINWKNNFIDNKLESKLTTSALDHDVILVVDCSKLNTIPSVFKLQVEYSPDISKLIEIELLYDRSDENNVSMVERKFVVRQPASKINYAFNSKTIRTKEIANITVLLHYVDYTFHKPDTIKASFEMGHANFAVSGLIETERNNLNIFTKSNAGAYYKGLEVEMKVNDKEPLNLNYEYNFKELSPSFTFSMRYGRDRQYHMYTGLPSKRELAAKLVHNIYGNEYVDGLFTLKLNTSSLLWMKILWTDKLTEQFSKAIISEYNDLKFVVEATGRQLIDVIDKNFGKTLVIDGRNLRNKITTYGSTEKKKIIDDYNEYVEVLNTICDNRNAMYCRAYKQLKMYWERYNIFRKLTDPIFEMMMKFCENILEIIDQTYGSLRFIFDEIEEALVKLEDVQKLKDNAKELLKKSINDAKKSINDMENLAVELLNDLEIYMNTIKNKCEELFEPLLCLLDDFVVYFENKLAFVQIIVLDTFDTIQQYIQKLEETKKLVETYRSFVRWLENLHLLELVESVSDFVEAILNTVLNDAKLVIDDYRPYVDTLYVTVFGNYDELKKLPQFSDFKEFINNIYQRTIWIWNYHNVIDNVKAYLHNLSSNLVNFLNIFASEYTGNNEQENIFGQFDYTFRPDLGLIEISQPLPVEWESFDKTPSFEQHPLYQQIYNKIDLIRHNRFDVYKNTMKTYLHYITKRMFSPAISNFAMIVGDSHFVTFNNYHFDFIGNCSYLLASDFHSNSFSLVINYASGKKSLSFINFENKIEVLSDFVVKLNGEKVNLPLLVDDFIVTRENENIFVENQKGLQVSCNFYFDYCSFEISEWLFGKTAGLLGTLDNEKLSDMTMPNGDIADTVDNFIGSWKLDDCDGTNRSNDTLDTTGSILVNKLFNTLCTKIFLDRKSTLSPCFSIVDAKPFHRMCLLDIRNTIKPTVCSATAAYKRLCKNHLVEVVVPNICVSCQIFEGSLYEKIFDGHNPTSIDIVFIQELDCLRNAISSLPKKLNAALNKRGYTNNKFAVVGYGGNSMMKPHTYTFDRKIWTTENNIRINSTLARKKKSEVRYTAADAIKYASEMNFRPAITKMFILIQCELCHEMDNSPEIYNMLGDRDIILHVLKEKPFKDTAYEILGLDANYRTLNKDGSLKNTTGNEKIIDELKDMCSGLALSTSGTVSDADLFKSNKHLRTAWSSFVAFTARQSSCQKCKCLPDSNDVGRIDCTRCMSPIVKQLLNEYESQAMEF